MHVLTNIASVLFLFQYFVTFMDADNMQVMPDPSD